MPPVVLADPLWWMAARLRRILTGLLLLSLAVGATASGSVPVAASLSGPSSAEMPLAVAASSVGELRPDGQNGDRTTDRVGDQTSVQWAAESELTTGWTAERPSSAGTPHRTLLLPQPATIRPAPGTDQRSRPGRHAAPHGQRAPPKG